MDQNQWCQFFFFCFFPWVKSINCAAPNADWTVISNCAELTLIRAQLFPVGFSCAEKLLDDCKDFLNSFFSLKILRPKRKSFQKKILKFSDFLHHYHTPLLLHFVDLNSALNDDFLQIWHSRAIFA